ncbi:MAG TPA: hypothetical protein VHQ64_09845 [Pyrinomonadaceae bacterium]|jgi:hypothetical protein|nr:hypothetical protein [Pyrinomonadaceae bacterium]
MAGQVYFFNLFNETAELSLNGGNVGGSPATGVINGWDASKGYTPAYIAVESVKHADEDNGKVNRGGDGSNDIRIEWDSGVAIGKIKFPTVDEDVSIDDDLVCYICKNSAFVETKSGFVSKAGQQALTFQEPS